MGPLDDAHVFTFLRKPLAKLDTKPSSNTLFVSTMTNSFGLRAGRFTSHRRLGKAIGKAGNLTILKKSRANKLDTRSVSPTNRRKSLPARTEREKDKVRIMKVKEMKKWLADFGDKNKQHYQRGRIRLDDDDDDDARLIPTPTSHDSASPRKDDTMHSMRVFHKDLESSGVNNLTVQAESSLAPTSPSSSNNSSQIDPKAHTGFYQLKTVPSLASTSPSSSTENCSPSKNLGAFFMPPVSDHESAAAVIAQAVSQDDSAAAVKGLQCITPKNEEKEPVKAATFVLNNGEKSTTKNHFVWDATNGEIVATTSSCSSEDALKINPSADPTETTYGDSEGTDALPHANTESSWDSSEWSEPDWPKGKSFEDSDDYDSSSQGTDRTSGGGSQRPTPEAYSRRKTFGGFEGVNDLSKDHIDLLQRQKPTSLYNAHKADDSSEDLSIKQPAAPEEKMRNANIFGNRTLTSPTLDFICHGKVDQSKYATNTISDSSDAGTTSSWSQDSCQPSVAPDAIDSRLARTFLEESVTEEVNKVWPQDNFAKAGKGTDIEPTKITRKRLNPEDLPFLKPKEVQKTVPIVHSPPKKGPVASAVRTFGGPGQRQTIVEQRKEKLEQLWAETKTSKHVTKVKWGVCSKTGTYRKKVVLDFE